MYHQKPTKPSKTTEKPTKPSKTMEKQWKTMEKPSN